MLLLRYEKATSLISDAIVSGRSGEIGLVVIDELQMIGEGSAETCRGAVLETMTLKVLHFSPQVRGLKKFIRQYSPSPSANTLFASIRLS